MSAFSVSFIRDRGFGMGFDLLNPKLKPERSFVGDFVNFCRCDPLLFDDPAELLLATEGLRVLFTADGVTGLPLKG